MIELSGVHKAYHQGKPNEFWALRGIDLCVSLNKVTVFMGPSGSGKTTLLTMIGGLARPTSGRVRLMERDISALPEKFLTDVRRSTFGFVFQSFNLLKGISALENVMIPSYPLGLPHDALRKRALELLDLLGMTAKAEAKAEWLSGGEAQRVAIARALINDPQVIIADEPTANLDGKLSGQFLEILAELKGRGKTLLITSHDPRIQNAPVVDGVVWMQDGQIASSS
jgi:putative ABC transport system ATP-binding protein